MVHNIYCGCCENGAFTEDIAPPDHERVIDGYYFCTWCWEYADWNQNMHSTKAEALVTRAQDSERPQAY